MAKDDHSALLARLLERLPADLDLHLFSKGQYGLSEGSAAVLAEACSVTLHLNSHIPPTTLNNTFGGNDKDCRVLWTAPDPRTLRSHGDHQEAQERAAYCLAILLLCGFPPYTHVERSAKKTGIDYWLGVEHDDWSFARLARLEVSSIAKEKENNTIHVRLKNKEQQTLRSVDTGLPAYVVIVEFAQPKTRVSCL